MTALEPHLRHKRSQSVEPRVACAIALEDFWNQLAETHRLSLLCGYHLDIFDLHVQAAALPEIVRVHNLPRPVADPSRLAAAVDEALTEVMGRGEAGQVYLRVAEQVPRTELPRAQAILAWLSHQDVENAQHILDRVRAALPPAWRQSPSALAFHGLTTGSGLGAIATAATAFDRVDDGLGRSRGRHRADVAAIG